MVPLFPELLPFLQEHFDQADDGEEYVITRYRSTTQNLLTQLRRIIRRAGLKPWPKLFQNMRSTRQTELTELTRLAYDTNPDAMMVKLKIKAIGLDVPVQQVVQQVPLVSLLVNSDIGTTSIVGLPREMQSASGPGDAESTPSVG